MGRLRWWMILCASSSLFGCVDADDVIEECFSATGNVRGTIRLGGSGKGGAVAIFTKAGETPLQVKADDAGVYTVDLLAADYSVTAEDGAYCASPVAKPLSVEGCTEEVLDLELDCVF